MKPCLLLLLALFLCSCADDTPPAKEVYDNFQNGFPSARDTGPTNTPDIPIAPRGH